MCVCAIYDYIYIYIKYYVYEMYCVCTYMNMYMYTLHVLVYSFIEESDMLKPIFCCLKYPICSAGGPHVGSDAGRLDLFIGGTEFGWMDSGKSKYLLTRRYPPVISWCLIPII